MHNKITHLIVLLMAFAGAHSAFAAEDGGYQSSEHLHQAPAGTFELTPAIGTTINGYTDHRDNYSEGAVIEPINLRVEYGFARLFSLALDLGYQTGVMAYKCPSNVTCPDNTHIHGLSDPTLTGKFLIDAGPGAVRLGVSASQAVENQKITSGGDRNVATGGFTGSAFGGYEFKLGPGVLGADLQQTIYQGTRRQQDDSANGSSDVTGGYKTGIEAFYEYNFRMFTFGGALNYAHSTSQTIKPDSTGVSSDYAAVNNQSGWDIYVPMHFTPSITLYPDIGVETLSWQNSTTLDKEVDFHINVAGRFAF